MNHNYRTIANWKLNQPYNQALQWLKNYRNGLQQFTAIGEVILCPNFTVLADAVRILEGTNIKIGAQGCSEHLAGNFTGEVDVRSLQEVGVTFCIVGHSEQRKYYATTPQQLAEKLELLVKHHIEPIFCIGEPVQGMSHHELQKYLAAQLEPFLAIAQKYPHAYSLAYEPVWAIGTNRFPDNEHIVAILEFLKEICNEQAPQASITFLYGGSVTPENSAQLKKIVQLNGFLIGNASLDFEKLQKILQ